MGRFETLLAYMDRLIELKKLNFDVDRDIKECNDAIRQEIGCIMGSKESSGALTGSGEKSMDSELYPFLKRKPHQEALAGRKFNPFFDE
ncbi:hypothetical protein ACQCN2_14360 [Brevibacillus ginsengisoli]|uniref:hypothetical protein n=1 Tax=Brevibacillus ginsengisoli TaxID=363854 RepID=UPI003CFB3782